MFFDLDDLFNYRSSNYMSSTVIYLTDIIKMVLHIK